jgi:3-isopropylmalate dehydrogenase
MVVVRENTEDLYTGIGGHFKKGTPDEVVIANQIFTRKGIERAVRYAFELARKRNKQKKLTLVDKANAIEVQQIWRRTVEEVWADYQDITYDFAYIDAACMWMVKNPESFDVVVTANLFGDILTDLAGAVCGGIGFAASANLNAARTGPSMFEPVHGAAHDIAGQNIANPLAAIRSASLMLDFLGESEAAARVDKAVADFLRSDQLSRSPAGADGWSTTAIGAAIAERL